ncbi:MAG TPA: GAF domain-containing SpoIIE family protein phosphatase, partial [Pyrinomonadaceae bacterium]
HVLARKLLLPKIELRYAPTPYDERKIFFDLGQSSRHVATIEQLYQQLAERVRNALDATNAAIFVRDDATGDFNLRILSSTRARAAETDRREKPLQLSKRAFVVRRLMNLSTPLVIEPKEIETWSQALNSVLPSTREERASEHQVLRTIESRMLIQIRQKNELVGILSFGPRRGGFQYSTADRELLMSIAAQLALVIDNARLTERMVAQERMRRELALAAEVQQRLLPSRAPEGVAMEIAGFCEPARGVGGDYYDFISFDNSQLGVAIADVAGKGMPAALLMSTVQATLRSLTARNGTYVPGSYELSSIVSKLNRLLFNSTNSEHYVTFFYATFDQATQRLTYVNAGHNPPLYLQADSGSEFRELTSGGLVAGAFEHAKYEQETVQMKRDDLLFLYTDGLTEAVNIEGEEFGTNRIMETLRSIATLSADQIRDVVVRRVKDWCAGMSLYDDLTFVVMKVK